MTETNPIALIETGGTLSMGYNRANLLEPMYDIRHFAVALAAHIMNANLDDGEKDSFLNRLTETRTLINHHGIDSVEVDSEIRGIVQELGKKIGYPNLTLEQVKAHYGLENAIERPYRIDSINFSLEEHYPLLRDTVMKQLREGKTAVIVGGTDTLEYYAAAFARDPEYQRYRLANPKATNSAIFVSSMYSFGDHPMHVAKILNGALELARLPDLQGAFALSASDDEVTRLTVHDLQGNFMKISAHLADAFRSDNPAGWFENGFFQPNPNYTPPTYRREGQAMGSQRVAAPLIGGNNCSAIIGYLRQLPDHAMVIEVDTALAAASRTDAGNAKTLAEMVRERAVRGVPTYFVNDVRIPPEQQDHPQPRLPAEIWNHSSFLDSLRQAGGLLRTEAIASVYLNAMFGKDMDTQQSIASPVDTTNLQQFPNPVIPAVGIQYVPGHHSFEAGVNAASELTNDVVISTLPGDALPERHASLFHHRGLENIRFWTGFKYNGREYERDGESFTERAGENHYAAASMMKNYVMPIGIYSPAGKVGALHEKPYRSYGDKPKGVRSAGMAG
jgi:hypothetical protein